MTSKQKGRRHRSSDMTEKALQSLAQSEDNRFVSHRLDQELPLTTDDWRRVEQLLNQLTEFAPTSLVTETAAAIASYADDQARRGYRLGQKDICCAMAEAPARKVVA